MSHTFTRKGPRSYRYYVCQNAQMNGWDHCPAPSIPAGEVERFVIEQLSCVGQDESVVRATVAQVRRLRDETINRLADEERALEGQLRGDNLALAGMPPNDSRRSEIEAGITRGESRLAQIQKKRSLLESAAIHTVEIEDALDDFQRLWKFLEPNEQIRLVELLVKEVSYDGFEGKFSILYNSVGIESLGDTNVDPQEVPA